MRRLIPAAFVAALGVLGAAGCGGGAQEQLPASPPSNPPPPIVVSWEQPAITKGVTYTATAPVDAVDGEDCPAEDGKHCVAVDFTVMNNSTQDLTNVGFAESRTDTGTADLGYVSDEELPTTFLPGDEATATQYFLVDDNATELRLEVTGAPGGDYTTPTGPTVHIRGPLN